MDNANFDKRRIDKTTEDTLMAAIEQYLESGACSVLCKDCGTPITFVKLSETASEHRCKCGKYNGTLKGL
jgi:hypothetical protein